MGKILLLTLLLFLAVEQSTVYVSARSEQNLGGALIAVDENTAETQNKDDASADVENDDDEPEVFLPTHEWQTIKPGQGIPRGLHVRINLETGQKEAKLMEGDDSSNYQKSNYAFDKTTVKQLKEALRLIPDDGGQHQPPGKEGDTITKFRSIDEIRADFDAININVTTENEIILELVKKYREPDTTDLQKIGILKELEYFLHQYDNAVDFVKMGGLTLMLPALNSSSEEVRAAAAFVLGSAAQSNPTVQVAAIDTGAMQQLLHVLAIDSHSTVKLKVMYALSSLMRHFPYAQKKFLDLGGLSVLSGFFGKQESDDVKLQVKAITLLYDVVLENQLTIDHISKIDDETQKEKLRQYSQVKMKEAVKQEGWCRYIPKLLGISEHDAREKVLFAMSVMTDVCHKEFSKFIGQLALIQEEYTELAVKESDSDEDQYSDAYFVELDEMISDLLIKLNREHDEL